MNEQDLERLCETLKENISNSSNIFLIGHNDPDLDSISSCMALQKLATALGKNAYIIVDNQNGKIESGVKEILAKESEKYNIITPEEFIELKDENSLLIMTDVNKKNMISITEHIDDFKSIIIIDHHDINEEETVMDAEIFISTKSSSACEIAARVLEQNEIQYDENMANYLLAGMTLDTRKFERNVGRYTFETLKKIKDAGATHEAVEHFFQEDELTESKIKNLMVNGAIFLSYGNGVEPNYVTFVLNRQKPKTIYAREDLAKTADRMLDQKGVTASFVLGYVDDEKISISARGKPEIHVGNIMSNMQGGGNAQSGGSQIQSDDIISTEEQLRKMISEKFIDFHEDVYNHQIS